jgi:chromosome segregation ATPase
VILSHKDITRLQRSFVPETDLDRVLVSHEELRRINGELTRGIMDERDTVSRLHAQLEDREETVQNLYTIIVQEEVKLRAAKRELNEAQYNLRVMDSEYQDYRRRVGPLVRFLERIGLFGKQTGIGRRVSE